MTNCNKCPTCGHVAKTKKQVELITEIRDGVTWYKHPPVKCADGEMRSFGATFPPDGKPRKRHAWVKMLMRAK